MIRNIFFLNVRLFLSLLISFVATGILVSNTPDSQYASFVFFSSVFSLGMSFPNSLSSVAQKFFIEKNESYLSLILIFVVISVVLTVTLFAVELTFFDSSSSFLHQMFIVMLFSNFLQIINALFIAHIFVTGDVYMLARVGVLDALIKGSFVLFYREVESAMMFWVLLIFISNFVSFLYYFIYFKKSIPKKLIYSSNVTKEILNFWRWFILGSVVKNLRSNGLVFAIRMSSYGDRLLVAYGLYKQLENGTKKIGTTVNSIARPRLIKINMNGDIIKLALIFRKVVVATLMLIVIPYGVITIFVKEFLLAWIGHIPAHSIDFVRSGLLLIFTECLFVQLMNLVYFGGSPKKFQLYGAFITFMFLFALVPIFYFDMGPLWFIWMPVIFGILGLIGRFLAVPKNQRNHSLISMVIFDIVLIFIVVFTLVYGLSYLNFVNKLVVSATCIAGLAWFYNRDLFRINKKSIYALFNS